MSTTSPASQPAALQRPLIQILALPGWLLPSSAPTCSASAMAPARMYADALGRPDDGAD
jgi:hypothetical protein